MRTRIGRRILSLILVPMAALLFALIVFAILETLTVSAQGWARHSSVVIHLSQQIALKLAQDDAGGTNDERVASAREIERDFVALRGLVSDNPPQVERLKRYEAAALAPELRPGDAGSHVRLASAQRDFDSVEDRLLIKRRANFERVRWIFECALILAVLAVIGMTVALYRALSSDIARRLEALNTNTQRFASGEPVGPPDSGNDELTEVDARFRLAYERLADREAAVARYRILSEQASDIMYFIDGPQIVEANEAAARAYGYTRDEMLGLTVYDLRPPELHEALAAHLKGLKEHPEIFVDDYETIHRRRDGSAFAVEIALRQATIAGRNIVFIVARDVTARRAADARLRTALLQANEGSRLKSEFVATMSHEIRTPMNAILGMTELLLESPLDGEQRELASTVRSSGQVLLRIIDDVLDFSKMEAGKIAVEMRAFNLTTCVESVAALLAPQARRNGLALATFAPPELPQLILGDELRIRQVLTNLLGNAIKFTSAGDVALLATILRRTGTTIDARFEVIDTGIGLDAAASAKLFRAFEQADGSITRRYGGTGLGLTISKRLVELMGGTIGVSSEKHVGSTFWFELPFHIAEDGPVPARSLRRERVLVADANATARRITARYLVAWGLDVDEASSNDAALRLCTQHAAEGTPYALVLIDSTIAPDSLATLARDVRDAASDAVLPVVLTSASDASDDGPRAIRADFGAYLVKPLRQSVLFDCVATFTRERPAASDDERSPAAAAIARVSEGSMPAPAPSRGRVLLVEDNPVNQRVGRKQLEKLGFGVTCADDGRAAIALVSRERFDVVLMDLQMPDVDGLTATRAIRRNEIVTGLHVPIVALTADARAQDRTECLASGMDDYLSKPVGLADLKTTLARWVTA